MSESQNLENFVDVNQVLTWSARMPLNSDFKRKRKKNSKPPTCSTIYKLILIHMWNKPLKL